MTQTANQYYSNLVLGISPGDLTTWQGQIEHAEKERMRDRSVMDILGAVRPTTEPTAASAAEALVDDTIGHWIQLSIEIQEKQYILSLPGLISFTHSVRIQIQDRVRRLSTHPREEDQTQIENLRHDLVQQLAVLDGVRRQAVQEAFESDSTDMSDDAELFDSIDNDENIVNPTIPTGLTVAGQSTAAAATHPPVVAPERTPVSLPSNWLSDNNPFRPIELELRLKQACRTLQTLRDVIADKSFQYSHVIRVAPKKGVRTRARAIIATLNHRIAYLGRVYGFCRAAMVRLAADAATLTEYPLLLPEHVKCSTAILDPNEPGSTRLQLSWIWQTGGVGTSNSEAGLQECESNPLRVFTVFLKKIVNRVHWLQARAQRDRWKEEFTLVGYEMQWTIRYYMHQSEVWEERGRVAGHSQKSGAAAYAARKTQMWRDMAAVAEKKFAAVNCNYVSVVTT